MTKTGITLSLCLSQLGFTTTTKTKLKEPGEGGSALFSLHLQFLIQGDGGSVQRSLTQCQAYFVHTL